MGFIIALPLVILGLTGKYLDARWGTTPWLTLVGIVLAIVATSVWLYRYLKAFTNTEVKIKTTTQN